MSQIRRPQYKNILNYSTKSALYSS